MCRRGGGGGAGQDRQDGARREPKADGNGQPETAGSGLRVAVGRGPAMWGRTEGGRLLLRA